MNSGFYFKKSDGIHQAFPVGGTARSEATGQPANLVAASDYPVIAECQWCHGRIRLAIQNQMEWRHAPARQPQQAAKREKEMGLLRSRASKKRAEAEAKLAREQAALLRDQRRQARKKPGR